MTDDCLIDKDHAGAIAVCLLLIQMFDCLGETSKPASGASGDNKEKDAKTAGEETEGEDEDEDDGDEDSNVNGKQLFMNLLSRYRALKWLYGHAAR